VQNRLEILVLSAIFLKKFKVFDIFNKSCQFSGYQFENELKSREKEKTLLTGY